MFIFRGSAMLGKLSKLGENVTCRSCTVSSLWTQYISKTNIILRILAMYDARLDMSHLDSNEKLYTL